MSLVNLKHKYKLKFNAGAIELIKTNFYLSKKSSHSEVVKFPQA